MRIDGAVYVETKDGEWYTAKSLMTVLEERAFSLLSSVVQFQARLDRGEVLLPAKACEEFMSTYEAADPAPTDRNRFTVKNRQRYVGKGINTEITTLHDGETKRQYLVVFGAGVCPLATPTLWSPNG